MFGHVCGEGAILMGVCMVSLSLSLLSLCVFFTLSSLFLVLLHLFIPISKSCV